MEIGVTWLGFKMNLKKKQARNLRGPLLSRLATWIAMLGIGASAQALTATLNVSNFGAQGDAVQFLVNTAINSSVITVQSTNHLSSADVGKLILLFGAGPATGPTNNQDLVATITQVSNGTNITMSIPAGVTSHGVFATYGTQNATAFQNCINAATGTNTIINIPAGTYLLISPQAISTSFVMPNYATTYPAVTIQKGGLHFLGSGMTNTILMGCGAWQLKGAFAYRGYMFDLQGPVTNDAPLIFDSLTMDGGVPSGNSSLHGFPASVTDGTGWDNTHHAVVDNGPPPLHAYKAFQNCRFDHWRGEMLISVTSHWDGYILVTNCVFSDGNATGFNFNFTHDINGCTFSNMFQVLEFYEAYASNACFFQNTLVTNITGNGMALNGAITNRPMLAYTFSSNSISVAGVAIETTPAENVYVVSNSFFTSVVALGLGVAGYQGSAINNNIVVAFNQFNGTYYALSIMGSGQNMVSNVVVSSNTAVGVHNFAYGYGSSANVSFMGNVGDPTTGFINSQQLQGQWFLDNLSDNLPFNEAVGRQGATNTISYSYGARQSTWSQFANSAFQLDDTHPQQVPPGALMIVSNLVSSKMEELYPSSINLVAPIALTNGASVTFQWNNGSWQLSSQLAPPTNLRFIGP
jgi:hypothetical protein